MPAQPSFRTVLRLWREDEEFRANFTATLAAAPFAAFRWECPPLTIATAERPFGYVLTNAPELCAPADPAPFGSALGAASGGSIAVFPNLLGDATLVVPRLAGPVAAYASLATFVRGAPAEQIDALWQAVGTAMAERVGDAPTWLSTAGNGVAWLHVRLDRQPKYYVHAPYRVRPDAQGRFGATA